MQSRGATPPTLALHLPPRRNVSHHRPTAAVVLALLLAGIAAPVAAQRPSSRAPAPAPGLVPGVPDSAVLPALRFRGIGPALMSGRIADVAVPPATRPGERLAKTFYVATAGGGVWKTTNGGVTYEPIFDAQRVSSIGAVAVAPSNPAVVWVGTGESNNLRSSSWGDGVYRSTDAGRTWSHMGLRTSQHIARIVVHPADEATVFVAAMGPLWAGGGERGLYRTRDGGSTWRNVLSAGEYTGVTDVVLDPQDPAVVYATTYQRDRRAWSFVGGGPESGIWKSTDGGDTWTLLTAGLPESDMGRIGLAVSRSQPNTVYATVDAAVAVGGIYRSDDAGASWRRVSELQSIPWFFGQIRVDPLDPERIYHLGVNLSVSDDGGATFRRIAANTHADHHAMWIDPTDPDHLIIGNDGGLYLSHDRGATWDFASNLPVATFYAVGVDMRDPYWIYGGLQDNGTFGAPSATRTNTGVTNADWLRVGGGDGFYAAIDPVDHNIVYFESQNGALQRFDVATQERKNIRPAAERGVPLRYNWMAPLLISPHDRATLYFGANHLFRSVDRGDSWERLGPDLTRGLSRDSLPIMGLAGPGGHRRNEGVADFGNITTVDESPLRRGLLYVGTDDGLLQVSEDAGANWRRVERFPGVPELTYVSRVVASAHHEGTVYVTFDGHRSNDFRPYVLRSTDHGRTFRSIAAGLPDDAVVYVLREHHRNPQLLFVGTEYGVFVSLDGGGRWTRLTSGLAPAPVHDLVIHPVANDLIVGTHGRGIYVLDDLAPLERLAAAATAVVHLFEPQPATIQNAHGGLRLFGNRNYTTDNPRARSIGGNEHSGASLAWFVGANAPREVTGTLEIRSAQGELVRALPVRMTPGLHRAEWDLRWSQPLLPVPAAPRRAEDEEETGAQRPAPGGPYVFPGVYAVQLQIRDAAGATRTVAATSLTVRPDPALNLSAGEYGELHAARMQARAVLIRIATVAERLVEARSLISDVAERDSLAAASSGATDLAGEIDALLVSMRGFAGAGGGLPGGTGPGGGGAGAGQALFGRVVAVSNAIGSAHFLPTPAHRQALADAEQELVAAEQAVADLEARARAVVQALRAGAGVAHAGRAAREVAGP